MSNRSSNLAFATNVRAVGVRCRLCNTKLSLKNKFDMENKTLTNHENGNDANRLLAAGFITKSGFKLNKKVETLDEFWQIINTDKSIFARHRMYPTAFFHSWNIQLIKQWLDAGWFFQACR